MKIRTLAHVSDLHLGKNLATEAGVMAIRDAVLAAEIDHVVITGDLTHRGRIAELASFWKIVAPLMARNLVTLVPGNHDRLGDDVADAIHDGPRVAVKNAPGLYLVRFDSTGPHNRGWLAGHGVMTEADVRAITTAVGAAPAEALVVVMLHHHVLPLPADHAAERLVSWLGYPYCEELERGRTLLAALRGRCDLLLHGHRHAPQATTLFADDVRPLSVYNAGSSTELGQVRVFSHLAGRVLAEPTWLRHGGPTERGARPINRMPSGHYASA